MTPGRPQGRLEGGQGGVSWLRVGCSDSLLESEAQGLVHRVSAFKGKGVIHHMPVSDSEELGRSPGEWLEGSGRADSQVPWSTGSKGGNHSGPCGLV